jgi:hypothetical protein
MSRLKRYFNQNNPNFKEDYYKTGNEKLEQVCVLHVRSGLVRLLFIYLFNSYNELPPLAGDVTAQGLKH